MSGVAQAQLPGDISDRFPQYHHEAVALVEVGRQMLTYFEHGVSVAEYPISTAKAGIGNRVNSYQTPLGWHYVRTRFGQEAPLGTIFVARGNTGKIAHIEQRPKPTGKDYVTTRILWLSGLEEGVNSGEGIDSYQRYIYIHGTHEEGLIGQPASRGCIRMKNADVIELFERMPEKSLVLIRE